MKPRVKATFPLGLGKSSGQVGAGCGLVRYAVAGVEVVVWFPRLKLEAALVG